MLTMNIKLTVLPDGTATVRLPSEITPGEHQATLLLIDDSISEPLQGTTELTPYPIGLTNNANTFRREQIYGDEGR